MYFNTAVVPATQAVAGGLQEPKVMGIETSPGNSKILCLNNKKQIHDKDIMFQGTKVSNNALNC